MRVRDVFELEIASAIFFVEGGEPTRSWHVRNGHPPEEFADLEGLRGVSELRLIPNKLTDIVITKKELIPDKVAFPQLWVADEDYKNLKMSITFNTQFVILGRCILQFDLVFGSDHKVLGMDNNISLVRNATIEPKGEVILRRLDTLEDWSFNRAFRAYVPILIRVVNPIIRFNVDLTTDDRVPPSYSDVFINITGVVQVMNSALKYIGYAREDEQEIEDWEMV